MDSATSVRSSGGGGGFVAPNAYKRRTREEPGKIPVRALEYKNLPFRQQSIKEVLGRAAKICREESVFEKFILVHYTRSQDVRQATEAVRERLMTMVNLSVSQPFLTHHTVPMNHTKETIERVSAALEKGPRGAWKLDEEHTHNKSPRASDYRTMLIQAATDVDFMCALKMCLELTQTFQKQVCVRVCSIEGGITPLPIYEGVIADHARKQFRSGGALPLRAPEDAAATAAASFPDRPVDSDLE